MVRQLVTFFFLIGMLYTFPGFSQTDSTAAADSSAAEEKEISKIENAKPRRAALMSALLPGLGQVYNHQYWKVPIIYALGGVVTYFFISNAKNYHIEKDSVKSYNSQYLLANSGVAPTFNPYQTNEDFYHKNRDLTALLMLALYAINILDASVDAHLKEFDIDEKLSLNFKPLFYPNYNSQFVTGLTVNLVFKK